MCRLVAFSNHHAWPVTLEGVCGRDRTRKNRCQQCNETILEDAGHSFLETLSTTNNLQGGLYSGLPSINFLADGLVTSVVSIAFFRS